MNDTDRMERPPFDEIDRARAPGAPPAPRAGRAKVAWAQPTPVPQVVRASSSAPVAVAVVAPPMAAPDFVARARPATSSARIAVREVAPLGAEQWGIVERIGRARRVAVTAARPAPVSPGAPVSRLVGYALTGVVAVCLTLAAVAGLDSNQRDEHAFMMMQVPAMAAAEEPQVEPAPAAELVPVVSPIVTTVAGHVTSEPAGAIVTLVEDGVPRVLGATPIEADLDPSRAYELLVEHPGYWSDVRLIVFEDGDASGDIREHVELSEQEPEPVAVAAAEEPPAAAPARVRARKATPRRAPSRTITERDDRGTLMLHAKPPCEIAIDGRDTGLTTPRRDIKLAPGTYKVTLSNREHQIREHLTVTIRAGRAVRVSRDMTSRLSL